MAFVLIYIALAVLGGIVASGKGRSFWGFFLLGLLLSPVIGLIAALVVGGDQGKVEAKQLAAGNARSCPFCAELIRPEAVVCKHCGRDVPAPEPAAIDPGIVPQEDRKVVIDREGYWTLGDLLEYAEKQGYSRAKWLLFQVYTDGANLPPNPELAAVWKARAIEEGFEEPVEVQA